MRILAEGARGEAGENGEWIRWSLRGHRREFGFYSVRHVSEGGQTCPVAGPDVSFDRAHLASGWQTF